MLRDFLFLCVCVAISSRKVQLFHQENVGCIFRRKKENVGTTLLLDSLREHMLLRSSLHRITYHPGPVQLRRLVAGRPHLAWWAVSSWSRACASDAPDELGVSLRP
jgi:hypothetical protein